ncbi:hypothetical protein D3C77_400460 [compost metagenome]
MAKQTINLGTAPSGAGGDDRRSAWQKAISNFNELYDWLTGVSGGAILPVTLPIARGGTGGSTPETGRSGLGLGSAATRNAGSTPGSLMVVGDRSAPVAASINSWGNSFEMWTSQGTVGAPEPGSFGTMINAAWSGGAYGTQILMSVTGRIWFRAGDYTSATRHEIYHTGNTTRAADGTLKAI